jgi:hypothetical protein
MSNWTVEEFQFPATAPTFLQDSPAAADNDDGNDNYIEYSDQPNKKKKHFYRKEAQQSYRQRVKSKRADIEAALEQSKQEIETLVLNNRQLKENHHALELLKVEADHLFDHILKAQRTLPADDPYQAGDNLLEIFYSGTVATDDHVRHFMALPPPVSAKIEIDHIHRLAVLMAEWNVCYSSRENIELRLKGSLRTRIKLTVLFPLVNPSAILRITKARAAPPPGSAAGDAARKRIAVVLEGLQLDLKQKEGVVAAFKEFRANVACLRAEIAMAQLALCTGLSSIIGNDSELPGQTIVRVEKALSVAESTSVLEHMPIRMLMAYTNLAESILGHFTTIQHATLLLGCMPHLPDYIAVAELMLEEMESQRR